MTCWPPAAALLAGPAVLPKKSPLTSYSYRLSHDHQQKLLAALDAKMIASRLATSKKYRSKHRLSGITNSSVVTS
jgi:hypothetical protein